VQLAVAQSNCIIFYYFRKTSFDAQFVALNQRVEARLDEGSEEEQRENFLPNRGSWPGLSIPMLHGEQKKSRHPTENSTLTALPPVRNALMHGNSFAPPNCRIRRIPTNTEGARQRQLEARRNDP
jgi:hypothetical protein